MPQTKSRPVIRAIVRPAAKQMVSGMLGSPNRSQRRGQRANKRSQQKGSLMELNSAAPAAMGHATRIGPPIERTMGSSHRVTHSELVLPQISFGAGTGFANVANFSVNPGLSSTFTWLSQVASAYTSYRVHSLRLRYVPIAPTSTQGDVIIFPAYNPIALAPPNEIAAANNKDTITTNVWQAVTMTLDPTAMMGVGPRKYIRIDAVPGDLKTYDCLKVFIAANNAADSSAKPIGKLFIDYCFELFDPIDTDTLANIAPTSTSLFTNSIADTLTTNVWTVVPLLNQLVYNGYNDPNGVVNNSPANGWFTLPNGWWRITYRFSVTDTVSENFKVEASLYGGTPAAPTFVQGNLVGYNYTQTGTPNAGQTTLTAAYDIIISCNGAGNTSGNTNYQAVVLRATGAAGTLTCVVGGSLFITPA